MRYTPDYEGAGMYLKFDPDLRAELHRRGELGLNLARALAPVLKEAHKGRVPGALAASGHVEDDGIGGTHFDRMQLSVVFDPVGLNADVYGAAGTWQHQRGGHKQVDYLLAAIPIIER